MIKVECTFSYFWIVKPSANFTGEIIPGLWEALEKYL